MDKRSTKRIKLSRPSQEKRDNDPPGDAIAPAAPGAVAQQPHVFPDDIFGEIIQSLDPFIICKYVLVSKTQPKSDNLTKMLVVFTEWS